MELETLFPASRRTKMELSRCVSTFPENKMELETLFLVSRKAK